MRVLSACISLYHLWYLQTPEESVISSGTRVKNSCEPGQMEIKPGSSRREASALKY